MARWLALVLVCALAGGAARAQSDAVHGRIEVQDQGLFSSGDSIEAASGARDADNFDANVRLTWEPTWGPWSLQVHYLADVEDGPAVRIAGLEAAVLAPPPATWLDLTQTIADHGHVLASQGLDRLAVTYTDAHWVVRVGRQALTWGSGLVFRPMDLVDPFSPTATDTEYKPGTDMLYVQRLFADGSDLQLAIAPRPPRSGVAPSADASTFALHLHAAVLGHETTWLIARDHGDLVGALGVNGDLGGATWNLEVEPIVPDRQGTARVLLLANISDAVTLASRNATVFAEYFHNGLGDDAANLSLASLPTALESRLARGQLFNVRRDYLAAGVTLEVTPLLSLSPTLIAGLDDASGLALLAATYSLGDNLSLVTGVQTPIGRSRTEFGGLPLTPGTSPLLAPPAQVYVQIRRYF